MYFDIKSLIKHAFLPKEIVIDDIDKLFDFLRKDKKVINNNLNFAMLDSPSHLIIHSMKIDNELKKTIKDYLLQTHEYYSD